MTQPFPIRYLLNAGQDPDVALCETAGLPHPHILREVRMMDLIEAVEGRRSVRAFRPDPVPKEVLEKLLRTALHAPSALNLQPWELIVVLGEERERLSRRLLKAYRERQISCGAGNVKPLPRAIARRGARTLELMTPLFEEMRVDPHQFINEGSCRFYGAPVAILLSLDRAFSSARFVDVGILLGYLLLAAWDLGLGTCPIGLIAAYEDEVKELLNIPEEKQIVVGLAVGYPDGQSPINRFKSSREDLRTLVRWID